MKPKRALPNCTKVGKKELKQDTEEARKENLNGNTEDSGGTLEKWLGKNPTEESPEQRDKPQIGKAINLNKECIKSQ
eukprot:2704304-Ditylum_brightwellii.AAC.1